MRVILANLILVFGFCMGTVGAAGFSKPVESAAWPLLGGGLGLVVLGGAIHRIHRRNAAAAAGDHAGATDEFRALLAVIRDKVVAIDDSRGSSREAEIRDEIDRLLRDEYFDFASRNEEWIGVLGFNCYAQVWDGVAVAERLLSRAWSMSTDGHHEEGASELPIARRQIERAWEAAQGI